MTDSVHTPTDTANTDEWSVAGVDLTAYLERIDHPRVSASAPALRTLHEAHVRAIPFENIDVVLGTHPGLELGVIADKLVRRHRGGYCYEHALLFAAVLERLGYVVERRIARVQPHRPGPRTHMMLAVQADGVKHLVDVGFGTGMLYPMPLRDGVIVNQGGWELRLTRDEGLWTLSRRTAGGWETLHASDATAQRPIDYEIAHHYTSTNPRSPFVGQLVVMRLDHGVNRRLVGNELTVEYADGHLERTFIPPDRLDATLRELDIVLEAGELDALHASCIGITPGCVGSHRPSGRVGG